MPIEHIKIRNFRSLREVSIDAKALTVFVGCNDEGKSNILRALDLFFNGDRRGGYAFNWSRDFSAFSKIARNKAPQIEITLTFKLPESFNVRQSVVWQRIWRKDGLHTEAIRLVDGNELPSRSKAYAYLKVIRYEYIPAIKGADYFERLLGSMHEMLDATVQKDIRDAAANFTTEIRKHTKGILADLEQQIGLKSDIELPNDLKSLFSELEFRSTIGVFPVALSQRGDGIKVRHIPVILRWLAEQANHLSAPGKPRVVTIWGYEEPENNLETRKCFDLADFFITTSESIQTFLTTHSPVFYTAFQAKENLVSLTEVKLDPQDGTQVTARIPGHASDVDALHSSIGFLDLLEPHVKKWREQVDRLDARIAEGINIDCSTVFVEGPSDKEILDAAFRRFFPNIVGVRVLCATKNGGGHAWVKDSLIAWHYSRATMRAIGLFDGDAASKPSIQEFQNLVVDRAKGKQRAHQFKIKPKGLALEITKAKLDFPVAIEELCPKEIWEKAEKNDWLVPRDNLTTLYQFTQTDITFNDWIATRLPDEFLRIIATKKVNDTEKERFSKLVAEHLNTPDCAFDFEPLHDLARQILLKLELITHTI